MVIYLLDCGSHTNVKPDGPYCIFSIMTTAYNLEAYPPSIFGHFQTGDHRVDALERPFGRGVVGLPLFRRRTRCYCMASRPLWIRPALQGRRIPSR
jgi:hypothetical protein